MKNKLIIILISSITLILSSCATTTERLSDNMASYIALCGGACMIEAMIKVPKNPNKHFYPCVKKSLKEQGYTFAYDSLK